MDKGYNGRLIFALTWPSDLIRLSSLWIEYGNNYQLFFFSRI